jgi:RimJ/RimL family protein N-acetyltransferase
MGTYPKEVRIGEEQTLVLVRPLAPDDATALGEFFRRIPEEDRYYLKEDVTAAEVIETWTSNINYDRVVPIVAVIGDRIVADATLHRHRAGARRHVGEIRVVVDPEYRHRGLGTQMVRETIDIAYDNAMESAILELVVGREDEAIRVAERLGFTRWATLPNFVKDLAGNPHELAVMGLVLDRWLDW